MKILIFCLPSHPLAPRLSNLAEPAEIQESHYDDLAFYLPNQGKDAIKILVDGKDIRDFDLVFFRRVEAYMYLVGPITAYLKVNSIPFLDKCNGQLSTGAKLWQAMNLQIAGLPNPKSLCYSPKLLAEKFSELEAELKLPFILKEYNASHGKLNFLVKSKSEFNKIQKKYSKCLFICQEYLVNNFDYRLVTIGHKVKVIKKRIRTNNNTHLNNTYSGAEVEFVSPDGLSELRELAEVSAKLLYIDIAGVDILICEADQKPYILEVNKAPDITDPLSLKALADYLKEFKKQKF